MYFFYMGLVKRLAITVSVSIVLLFILLALV